MLVVQEEIKMIDAAMGNGGRVSGSITRDIRFVDPILQYTIGPLFQLHFVAEYGNT